jgi:hypothetical protein
MEANHHVVWAVLNSVVEKLGIGLRKLVGILA